MYRILLVIDDYNELVYLQTLLKKMSFDVEGIQNQKKFENIKLGFNPQMVIATAQGKNINGIEIAKDLKKTNGHPILVLLKSVTQVYKQGILELPQIDEVLDAPVNVHKLLSCISVYSKQDINLLMDKYAKIKGVDTKSNEDMPVLSFETETDDISVKGTLGGVSQEDSKAVIIKSKLKNEPSTAVIKSTVTNEQRKQKFKDFLEQAEPIEKVESFPRERIIAYNKKIRKDIKPLDNEDLEASRKSFVKALFKKS